MKKKSLILLLALIFAVCLSATCSDFSAYAVADNYTLTLNNANLVEVLRGDDVLTPEQVSDGTGGYLVQASDSIKIQATEALGKDKEYIAKYNSTLIISGTYDYSGFPEENATFAFVMSESYTTDGELSLTIDQQSITKVGQFSVSGGTIQSIKRYDPTITEGDKWKELVTNTTGTTYSSLYRSDRVIIKINDPLAENKNYTAKKSTETVDGIFDNEEQTFSFTVEEFSGSYALVISQEYYEIRINVTEDEFSAVSMSAGGVSLKSEEDAEGKFFTAKYNDNVVFYLSSKTEGYHIDDFIYNAESVKAQSGFKNNTYEKIEVKDATVYKSASYEISGLKVDNKGDEIDVALSSALNVYSVVYKVWSDIENDWVTAQNGDLTVSYSNSAVAPLDKGSKAHYYFVEWKEGKDILPITTLENVTENHLIYASYAKVKYSLNLFVGSDSDGDELKYEHGSNVELDIQDLYGYDFIYTITEEGTTLSDYSFDGKTLRFIMPTYDISVYIAAKPAHNVIVTINGLSKEYSITKRFEDGSAAEIFLPAGFTYSMENSIGHNTIVFSRINNSLSIDVMPANEVTITMGAVPFTSTGEVESDDYNINYEFSGEDVEFYGTEQVNIEYAKLSDKGIDESALLNGLTAQFPILNGSNFLTMDLLLMISSANGEKTASVKSGGSVDIIVKLDKDFIKENIRVFNYSQGGFIELDSNIFEKDGEMYLSIKTNHFSPFIIASYDTPIINNDFGAGAYVGLGFGIVLFAAVIFIFIIAVKNIKKGQNTK